MIRSIFQKPSAVASKPAAGLFKKPAPAAEDCFKSAEPVEALKLVPVHKLPQEASLSRASLAPAAASLPGPAAALYHTVLNAVADSNLTVQQLEGLVKQGKLSQDTLQNLSALTQKQRAAGLDGAALTRETVAILSGPDQNIWQGQRFTCGATNLERQLAGNFEHFTSLVENLSSLEGRGYLISGALLQRAEGSLQEDGSGRSSTDRLLQSSLMAAAGAGRGAYDVASDCFSDDKDGGGLKIAEISRMTALTQNQAQVVIAYDSKSAKATQELLTKLKPGETFQTAMTNWEGKDHMLLLQGCQDGQVTYFDPADHAQHAIGMRDYLWKTQFLVLPQALAERVEFAPESVHSRAELPRPS